MLDRLRAQAQAPARAACAGPGAQLPPVPHQGLSLAALRAFAAKHAAHPITVAAHDGAGAPQVTLPFGELTTAQVVAAIIKPATRCDKCTYAALLGTRVRGAGSRGAAAALRRFAGCAGRQRRQAGGCARHALRVARLDVPLRGRARRAGEPRS